jgi:hypothetical protein
MSNLKKEKVKRKVLCAICERYFETSGGAEVCTPCAEERRLRMLESIRNPLMAKPIVETIKRIEPEPKGVFYEEGWISPKGKLYKSSYMEHRGTAERILFTLGNPLSFSSDWQMDEYLQKKGWIKIANGKFLMFSKTEPKITKKQLDWFFDYIIKLDKKSIVFNEKIYKNYKEFLEAFT